MIDYIIDLQVNERVETIPTGGKTGKRTRGKKVAGKVCETGRPRSVSYGKVML